MLTPNLNLTLSLTLKKKDTKERNSEKGKKQIRTYRIRTPKRTIPCKITQATVLDDWFYQYLSWTYCTKLIEKICNPSPAMKLLGSTPAEHIYFMWYTCIVHVVSQMYSTQGHQMEKDTEVFDEVWHSS